MKKNSDQQALLTAVQIPLGLQLRDEATFSNFYAGDHAVAIAAIQRLLLGPSSDGLIYLWGSEGSGRTHLLQASCHELCRQGRPVFYLPLHAKASLSPAILEGMEMLGLVCLDDVDAVLGEPRWEEALFHFYNKAQEQGTKMLWVGDSPPLHLPCLLPDLRTRLGANLVFQIRPLDDEQKIAALKMRAHHRGIELNDEVGWFLLRRNRRDMTALFAALERLDRASLAAQRRLTIPFVKSVLHV